ncbi:MAG: heat-inducible transcription repressor HrcA [Chloroflexi bacterium]|nr:heat-inducible transcription repressor HrcA [Chloroflexota bacterium]MBI2979891.1 heat-inducible transcription repressor HrcA [Chloroflexota bacterium]
MLSPRAETILKYIVGQYIAKARPVPSQSITDEYQLGVSSATIRNEMAYLEQEGYITRPHPSAGSVPSDKGYRHYVESLGEIKLPLAEQRLVSHLFHQVEKELDEWLHLAATLMAQMVHNTVVVTIPKPKASQLKHLELVSLQDYVALVSLILSGIKVKQQLITFSQMIDQAELTAIANKLTANYSGLTSSQITAKGSGLTSTEQQITDSLVNIMETEDDREYEEQYLDGLHFMLSQPEFAHNQRMLTLMELVEERSLLKSIIPAELAGNSVQVIIGKENKLEAFHDYSLVINRYGLPEEAIGTISVIGPTRMPYAHTIATVGYLSSVLSRLAARLYGKEIPAEPDSDANN